MDVLDGAAEVVANLVEKGQAVAAVLGGAVIYLIKSKSESDKRAEKRTEQMLALIDSTNAALHPIGSTLQAGREAIARAVADNFKILALRADNPHGIAVNSAAQAW